MLEELLKAYFLLRGYRGSFLTLLYNAVRLCRVLNERVLNANHKQNCFTALGSVAFVSSLKLELGGQRRLRFSSLMFSVSPISTRLHVLLAVTV